MVDYSKWEGMDASDESEGSSDNDSDEDSKEPTQKQPKQERDPAAAEAKKRSVYNYFPNSSTTPLTPPNVTRIVPGTAKGMTHTKPRTTTRPSNFTHTQSN